MALKKPQRQGIGKRSKSSPEGDHMPNFCNVPASISVQKVVSGDFLDRIDGPPETAPAIAIAGSA
jgi:hypothetical protein